MIIGLPCLLTKVKYLYCSHIPLFQEGNNNFRSERSLGCPDEIRAERWECLSRKKVIIDGLGKAVSGVGSARGRGLTSE
jgi:hypothetical protein